MAAHLKLYTKEGNGYPWGKSIRKLLNVLIVYLFMFVFICYAQTPEDESFKKGMTFENSGRFDLAIEEFSKAIKINPNYAKAYLERGHAYYMTEGNYTKAIADYTKAIEINPNDVKFYKYRGFAYKEEGKFDQAMTDLNRAIEIDPQDGWSYFQRGLVYYDLKQYDKAWPDLHKGEKFAPPGLISSLKKTAGEDK